MKSSDKAHRNHEPTQLNRRDFLKTGVSTGAVVASASLPLATPTAQAAAQGPARKLIWVTHSIAEWNLTNDVGFLDFAEQAGWSYQKLGVPGAAYSVESNINQVKLAIQAKPDVIVGTLSNPALEGVLTEAEEAGILVLINNTSIEEIRAAHNWSFVGPDGYDQGLLSGRHMGNHLVQQGRTGGVLSYGNAEPGHVILEARKQGTIDGLKEINEKHGTTFTVREFADQSHDLAQSIPLYSSVRNSLGDDLAGFAVGGFSSMVAAFRALEQAGFGPGEIPVGGFDTGPDINEGIDKGYIIYAVEQELYNQAYLTAAIAWARLERLNLPPLVNTGEAVVTKDNLQLFAERSDILLRRAKELGLRR